MENLRRTDQGIQIGYSRERLQKAQEESGNTTNVAAELELSSEDSVDPNDTFVHIQPFEDPNVKRKQAMGTFEEVKQNVYDFVTGLKPEDIQPTNPSFPVTPQVPLDKHQSPNTAYRTLALGANREVNRGVNREPPRPTSPLPIVAEKEKNTEKTDKPKKPTKPTKPTKMDRLKEKCKPSTINLFSKKQIYTFPQILR